MTKEYRVLVVDDAKNIHEDIKIFLKPFFSDEENKLVDLKNKLCETNNNRTDTSVRFTIDDAYQGEEAIAMVENAEREDDPYALIIMDIVMPPGMDGVHTIKEIWKHYPHIEVIIITAFAEYELQDIQAELGITDRLFYLHKPFHSVTFKQAVLTMVTKWDLDRVSRRYISDLEYEVSTLKGTVNSPMLEKPEAFRQIITQNAEMINIFKKIEYFSKSSRCILITGETGTGKELFTKVIHQLSGRNGELVVFDVGKEDANLFSSALFGHKRGAFTNAEQERRGAVLKAKDGTLFLDEIQNLPMECQIKILGFLETGKFKPVGSDEFIQSDARIIAATNADLIDYVEDGIFRHDLYQRLTAHTLYIPSLRERKEDIPLLLNHFLERASIELGKNKPRVPNELNSLLSSYHYPGNVRELENMVFNAVCQHESKMLSMKVFREHIFSGKKRKKITSSPGISNTIIFPEQMPTLKQVNCDTYEEALRRAKRNVKIASDFLNVTPQAVYKHLNICKRDHFR